jgi:hypothetical protein
MKVLVWHSRKNERAARRVMFKRNMVYYLLCCLGFMAVMILLHELTRGLVQIVALAGVLLSLIAMLSTLAIRVMLNYQAARDTRANQPAIVEYHFGTKFITRTSTPLAEAGARRAPSPQELSEKLAYADIRALKEDSGFLYLFLAFRQPPIAIGLGTEGIEQIRKILMDRTGKKIGRI